MTWSLLSKIRFFASVTVALVGVSAASAWISLPSSQAQSPAAAKIKDTMKEEIAKEIGKLEIEEAKLKASGGLSEDHPKLVGLRAQLAALKELQARDQSQKAEELARKAAEFARRRASVDGQLAEVRGDALFPSDLVTENLVGGTQKVVVRQLPDGTQIREIRNVGDLPAGDALPLDGPGSSITTITLGGNQEWRQMKEMVEKLQSKESSDVDKRAAREKLQESLGRQFDEDLKQREQQIDELEKQLGILKEQIAKRREAKSRLIDLRIELLMNESQGLGFPNAWQTTGRSGLGTTIPPAARPAVPMGRARGLAPMRGVMVNPGLTPAVPPAPAVAPVAPVPPAAIAPDEELPPAEAPTPQVLPAAPLEPADEEPAKY